MACAFYVLLGNVTYGPYSTADMIDLQLPPDVQVREESLEEWLPAHLFDFQQLLEFEQMGAAASPPAEPPYKMNANGELVFDGQRQPPTAAGQEEDDDEDYEEEVDENENEESRDGTEDENDEDEINEAKSHVAANSPYYMNANGELVFNDDRGERASTRPSVTSSSSDSPTDDYAIGWRLAVTLVLLVIGFLGGIYLAENYRGSWVPFVFLAVGACKLIWKIWKK